MEGGSGNKMEDKTPTLVAITSLRTLTVTTTNSKIMIKTTVEVKTISHMVEAHLKTSKYHMGRSRPTNLTVDLLLTKKTLLRDRVRLKSHQQK